MVDPKMAVDCFLDLQKVVIMSSHHLNCQIGRKKCFHYFCITYTLMVIVFSYTILVNRGWVSMKNKNPASRIPGQVSGEIELEGIVRLTEPRPQFVTKNVSDSRFWAYRYIIHTIYTYLNLIEKKNVLKILEKKSTLY